MPDKPYVARTITGAQRRVRQLENQVALWRKMHEVAAQERDACALLAAEGPAFKNPLRIIEAKKIRDRVLWRMGLNPDGSYRNA